MVTGGQPVVRLRSRAIRNGGVVYGVNLAEGEISHFVRQDGHLGYFVNCGWSRCAVKCWKRAPADVGVFPRGVPVNQVVFGALVKAQPLRAPIPALVALVNR